MWDRAVSWLTVPRVSPTIFKVLVYLAVLVLSKDQAPVVNEGRWWVGVRAIMDFHLKARPQ